MQVANFHSPKKIRKEKEKKEAGDWKNTEWKRKTFSTWEHATVTQERLRKRMCISRSPLSATSPLGQERFETGPPACKKLPRAAALPNPPPHHHKEIIYCLMRFKASSQKPLLGKMICIKFLIG